MWYILIYIIAGILVTSRILYDMTEEGLTGEELLDDMGAGTETIQFYAEHPKLYQAALMAAAVVAVFIWPLTLIYFSDDND